jgi:hypothetical protein
MSDLTRLEAAVAGLESLPSDEETADYLGRLDKMLRSVESQVWLMADIGTEDECWPWSGGTSTGYGRLWVPGVGHVPAHRISYEALRGPIPAGLVIDHLCRNRACINPAHLEPVTLKENILRGEGMAARRARQTHCKRGHPLSGANLYRYRDGRRDCRACWSIRKKERG